MGVIYNTMQYLVEHFYLLVILSGTFGVLLGWNLGLQSNQMHACAVVGTSATDKVREAVFETSGREIEEVTEEYLQWYCYHIYSDLNTSLYRYKIDVDE